MKSCVLAVIIGLPLTTAAQSTYDEFVNQARNDFEQFRNKSNKDFEEFRKKINDEYAAFLETSWKPVKRGTPEKPPKEHAPLPPVVFDPKQDKKTEPKSNPIEIKGVIKPPTPVPKPEPIVPLGDDLNPNPELAPFKENPKPENTPITQPKPITETVSFLGTPLNVRWDKHKNSFCVASISERDIASAWKKLSDGRADKLLRDCLDLRKQLDLSDWVYLRLLSDIGSTLNGKGSNEATLLTAWLYSQSGYKMRLGSSNSGKLYMLYASEHLIYNTGIFYIDDTQFYPYNCSEKELKISTATFPKERPLSLIISAQPRLKTSLSDPRELKSKRYPEARLTSQVNRNLMDLYENYPSSTYGGNLMTCWGMYANVPASDEMRKFVYPQLQEAIAGKDKRAATEVLLNWVQTAFPYEYDEVEWGRERTFFADETLFYRACDCEDRSILFSRLVRDLLGLDAMLVYYPGHLATAVAFGDNEPRGDYLTYKNRIFTICDPTYINAGTGRTMPGMDNSKAQVILLTGQGNC